MNERRRNNRMQLDGKLIVKRVGSTTEEQNEVIIDVIDVSKTGVGFSCETLLNIGAVYETFLTLWTKDVIHAFMEIVRIEKKADTYAYGAIFIGMPEMDASRISVYETVENEKKNQ